MMPQNTIDCPEFRRYEARKRKFRRGEGQPPLLMTKVLGVADYSKFEKLKNSSDVMVYIGCPNGDYAGSAQILEAENGEPYMFFAGDDISEATKVARKNGLVINGFLKPENFSDVNDFLGHSFN